jgi:DNA-binding CsgD family transcriptional regulator
MPRQVGSSLAKTCAAAAASLGDARLTDAELHRALDTLHAIGEGIHDQTEFALRGVEWLPRLVASELTTLSVCDLETAHRGVVSDLAGAISSREIQAFDRHFFEHPLVRDHGRNAAAVTRRIDDLLSETQFRRTPLYGEYYRIVGVDRVMAVPILVDRRFLVSFVFNRSGRRFTDRDRALVEVIRPQLSDLYRLSGAADGRGKTIHSLGTFGRILHSAAVPLTARERDVLQWLAAGKTDRDIAAILEISPRTVHKHLQRIYAKLGVETRTAAVMRLVAAGSRSSGALD